MTIDCSFIYDLMEKREMLWPMCEITGATGSIEIHHAYPKGKYPEVRDLKKHPWNAIIIIHFIHGNLSRKQKQIAKDIAERHREKMGYKYPFRELLKMDKHRKLKLLNAKI